MGVQEIDIDYSLVQVGDKSLLDYIEQHIKHKFMDRTQEITNTKQLRKDIDEILQRVKALKPSRETSLAITKLQESVMWLGMNLKRLGEENPYPDSYNPDNTNIASTADGLKL